MSKPTTPDSGASTATSGQGTRGRGGRSSRNSGHSGDRGGVGRDGYVVRPYRAADREQFLQLYEAVFGDSRTEEWFDWRYGGPYTDEPRMFVAERDGELVGAEPFISFAMRAGDEETLAIQPADAMVHPDHRRNGLLTRMTERAIDYFERREPTFIFNFPNEEAKGAYLKLGWVEVGTVSTAYRVHNPSTFFESSNYGVDTVAGPAANAGTAAYHRVRDAISTTGGDVDESIDVRRFDGVPTERLASLYEASVPDRIHTPRTTEFLDWRFANPNWDVTTYTADRDGDVRAAIVTAAERDETPSCVKILDAYPMVGQSERADAYAALVDTLVRHTDDVDAVAVAAETLPPAVLSSYGFLRDDRPPLSLFGSMTTVVARPLVPSRPTSWTVGDRHLPERRDWRLPFAEQDCSG